jgi:hypothetical protein
MLATGLACGAGERATTAGGGSAGAGPGGTSTMASGAAGSGGAAAGHVGALVDDGLVARYYLDEAADGQAPAEALDAAPAPLNLTLRYVADPCTLDPVMSYIQDAEGHRGLDFSTAGMDDLAFAEIDESKFIVGLHRGTSATYEVVADIREIHSGQSRLSHIGSETGHALSLQSRALSYIGFEVNTGGETQAPALLDAAGRAVYHAVFDSTEVEPMDRVKFYLNASRLPTLSVASGLAQGEEIDLSGGKYYAIGNREIGGRTMRGTIFYSAVYASALSAEQVAQNTSWLLVDDDTPPHAPTEPGAVR